METPTLFNLVILVACGALALWTNSINDKNKDRKTDNDRLALELSSLSKTVTNMRESIPQRYATIDDLKETTDRFERTNRESADRQDRTNERIFSTLERIENKIDKAAQ